MSRNGSGVYTKVNTFTAGNPVTAAGHNQNWDDIVSEITNSVAADGQTPMTGPLKAASGTLGAPSLTFASDPDSGIYRIGSNNVGVAVGGAKIIDVSSTGAAITGDLNATTVKQNSFALMPVGMGPLPWSGTTAPAGWVLTGQTLSRATYAALWTFAEAEIALGNTLYTNGNGSTTFTIASTAGRVLAGKEASASVLTSTYFGGNSTILGATGGLESKTLSATHLPPYTPAGVNSGSLATLFWTSSGNYQGGSNATAVSAINGSSGGTTSGSLSMTQPTFTGTPAAGQNSTPFNIVQPTIICNYIIFAGV